MSESPRKHEYKNSRIMMALVVLYFVLLQMSQVSAQNGSKNSKFRTELCPPGAPLDLTALDSNKFDDIFSLASTLPADELSEMFCLAMEGGDLGYRESIQLDDLEERLDDMSLDQKENIAFIDVVLRLRQLGVNVFNPSIKQLLRGFYEQLLVKPASANNLIGMSGPAGISIQESQIAGGTAFHEFLHFVLRNEDDLAFRTPDNRALLQINGLLNQPPSLNNSAWVLIQPDGKLVAYNFPLFEEVLVSLIVEASELHILGLESNQVSTAATSDTVVGGDDQLGSFPPGSSVPDVSLGSYLGDQGVAFLSDMLSTSKNNPNYFKELLEALLQKDLRRVFEIIRPNLSIKETLDLFANMTTETTRRVGGDSFYMNLPGWLTGQGIATDDFAPERTFDEIREALGDILNEARNGV